jgi:FKBP-type peptidyl-prolyl cis-trans isomerase SlyD
VKIVQDTMVELEYELLDKEGEVLETTADDGPVTYLHGHGEILGGLERALDGAEIGANLTVTLAPEDAYGLHDPEGIVAVPRSEFPADAEIVPGDCVDVTVDEDDEDEGTIEMVVVEIRPDTIFLDANHPLAGQEVTFRVNVLTVREATEEEIAQHGSQPDESPGEEEE